MPRPLDGHPLVMQFAVLPTQTQGHLFALLDLVGSMTEEQMNQTRSELSVLAAADIVKERPLLLGLFTRMANLLMWEAALDREADLQTTIDSLLDYATQQLKEAATNG